MRGRKQDRSWETSRLKRQIFLTRMGMFWEEFAQCFWPLWTVVALVFAGVFSGLAYEMPDAWLRGTLALSGLLALAFLIYGARQFYLPTRAEALARLDENLPGDPLASLTDSQGMGGDDPASRAIWRAHQARMRDQAAKARAPRPDARLARRDPFAFRLTALLSVCIALFAGSLSWLSAVPDVIRGQDQAALDTSAQWEGWIEPPAYTGLPVLYLNDLTGQDITAPVGSDITLRFYGTPGALALNQTVADLATPEGDAAPDMAPSFTLSRSGLLEITGAEDARWVIAAIPDQAPSVEITGEVTTEASGMMTQEFTATDDYGVTGGQVTFTLDESRLMRRFGLATDPDPRDPLTFDLPIPYSGDRAEFTEEIIENLSEHPWSGLPVQMVLTVTDDQDQQGVSEPAFIPLPGRRFFDPLARAVIEMRRDILWARANALETAQMIRAISHRPGDTFPGASSYLMLRTALRRLEAEPLTPETQQEIADALWRVALIIEDGSLSDALERMRRAQERLTQAMRDGASDEEIQQLMDELRDATRDYLRQLAQNPEDTTDEPNSGETQQLSGADIQEMMDRIQELMEQGRMAEAQELLNELAQMMENMRVTQGNGDGDIGSPGEQAMDELGDSIEEQQGLSDQAFRDLQEQFNPNAQSGQSSQNEGRSGSSGRGQQHSDQEGASDGEGRTDGGAGQGQTRREQNGRAGDNSGQSLADRQQALRDEIDRQRGNLPGAGTPEGDAAREALDRAGEAMDRAEDKLRSGDLAGALEDQAEAMEQMREGMRQLERGLAGNRGQEGEEGEDAQQGQNASRDPLGREQGRSGANGTTGGGDLNSESGNLAERALELMKELRGRSSDQSRPEEERDYLDRLLLDRFGEDR